MTVTYQDSTISGGVSVTSLSANIALTAGSNLLYVAIITTYETSGSPKDVSTVVRAGESFIEATAIRQDLTISATRFPRVKVFIFYLPTPTVSGLQSVVVTLSGTAAYATMCVFQVNGAYQGAPVDYEIITDQAVSGNVGLSATILDTQTSSLILNQVNLLKATNGGNGPESINAVNLSTVASASTNSTFWRLVLARTGVAGDFETLQSMGWDQSGIFNDILCDYVFVAVEIQDSSWTPSTAGVDPSDYCAYVSNGQVRKMVNTITGLDHLEGEEIKVQMDGILPTDSDDELVDNAFTVTSGSITLPKKAAVVHAGLGYVGTIQLLKSSEGSQLGTGQFKMRRVYLAALRLYRTLGLKIGLDVDHLDPISDDDPALPLTTGDIDKLPNANWDKETEIIIRQEEPLPAQILAVILRSEVEEKG